MPDGGDPETYEEFIVYISNPLPPVGGCTSEDNHNDCLYRCLLLVQCAKKIIIIKILHRKTSIIPAVYLYLANNFTWLHNEYIYIMPIIIYLRFIYALWRYSKANMVYSTFA